MIERPILKARSMSGCEGVPNYFFACSNNLLLDMYVIARTDFVSKQNMVA